MNIAHLTSRLYLIWIHTVLFILVFGTPEDDEKFIELYGTDRMTSGAWELIKKFPLGDPELEMLAKEAHRTAGMGVATVSIAVQESRWLNFYDPDKHNFIKIDLLVYGVEGYVKNDTRIPYFFYITKGLKPDCVYYLEKENLEAINLKLDRHVCGILMPSPPPP